MTSQATAHLKATIAANIDRAVAATGKTNREIGESLDASEAQVWKWRKGKHGISQTRLVEVADLLGYEVAWFMTDHSSEPEPNGESAAA